MQLHLESFHTKQTESSESMAQELTATTHCTEEHMIERASKPKRPLSTYNYFFQSERKKMLLTLPTRPQGKPRHSHGKCDFASMAKAIAQKWKEGDVDQQERMHFEQQARQEKIRYKREMAAYKKKLGKAPKKNKKLQCPKMIGILNSEPVPQTNTCLMPITPSMDSPEATKMLQNVPVAVPSKLFKSVSENETPSFCLDHGIDKLVSDLGDDGVTFSIDLFRSSHLFT